MFRRYHITESFNYWCLKYICISHRSYGFICLKSLLLEIKKINRLEKKIAEANVNKHKSYLLKWNKIENSEQPITNTFFNKRISSLLSTWKMEWVGDH